MNRYQTRDYDEFGKTETEDKDNEMTEGCFVKLTSEGIIAKGDGYGNWKENNSEPGKKLAFHMGKLVSMLQEYKDKQEYAGKSAFGCLKPASLKKKTAIATTVLAIVALTQCEGKTDNGSTTESNLEG